jgi:dihydroorotate dehydrogenase (fumarate)
MRLPLRWIAILYGRVKASLAATTGIHTAEDVIKMMMVGADVTMLASVLLKGGLGKISDILTGMKQWMTENEYESVKQMKGSMSYQSIAEPAAFERANYIKTLQSFK